MKKKMVTSIVMAIGVVAFLGVFTMSFAGPGMGGRNQGWGGQMPMANLSDEQIDQLQKEREAYFTATNDLRSNLRNKQSALRAELSKKEPDAKKATSLQKEVSDLSAQFDQKRLEHHFAVKKINPEAGAFSGRGACGFGGRGRK